MVCIYYDIIWFYNKLKYQIKTKLGVPFTRVTFPVGLFCYFGPFNCVDWCKNGSCKMSSFE